MAQSADLTYLLILLSAVVSAVILTTVYFKTQRPKVAHPMAMPALERLTLFCERNAASQLLAQPAAAELNTAQMHTLLLQQIRQEYQHNATQQLHVPEHIWLGFSKHYEAIVSVLNQAAGATDLNQPALAYLKTVAELWHTYVEPGKAALQEALRATARQLA
jgi:hypothetical protein